jgi:hypothetical protein
MKYNEDTSLYEENTLHSELPVTSQCLGSKILSVKPEFVYENIGTMYVSPWTFLNGFSE